MLPVIVPIVQLKLLGAVAVSGIFVVVLLQIATAEGTPVTCGIGFTVTVIVYGALAGQLPPVDVAVTRYCTEPGVAFPGLVSVWLIVEPEPFEAPVIPPVIVPIVQLKLLGAVALNGILVLAPLHIAAVAGTPVTCGVGLTVTVITNGALEGHVPPSDVAVTRY